jgi:NAD(P)-dependent dehydrogenase (short-subunit alcohol dehydrogenase family)
MNTAMHRAAEPEEDPSEWANPADVTDVFVFLASDESKGITGKRFQAQEDWKAAASA